MGEVIMNVMGRQPVHSRGPLLGVLVAASMLLGLVVVPALAARVVGGPREQMPGAEPGSEKARLVDEFQRQYEDAAVATMAPPAGRPAEEWSPLIVEGIDNSAENPFEGSRDFVLSNMWQSALNDGRVIQVYAGLDGGQPALLVIRLRVMQGVNESVRRIALPTASGTPRITAAENGILTLLTEPGRSFRFDVAASVLSTLE